MKFSKENAIYLQLIENIKVDIINGRYKSGDKLPSIRDYSKEMMVNPNTSQRAFRELELQNFVVSKTGLGYFVNEDSKIIEKLKSEYLEEEIKIFIDKMSKLQYSKSEIIEKVRENL